jgi:peptide deformylase
MAVREILLLGDERLYTVSQPVGADQLTRAADCVADLRDTMLRFREKYGFGRAIAAPQIGEFRRIIYMDLGSRQYVFINPRLEFGEERFELWDDCMSFPGLEVRLSRFKRCKVYYQDLQGDDHLLELEDDLAELIQHEYDHLDGVLAVQRALDDRAFHINPQKAGCF